MWAASLGNFLQLRDEGTKFSYCVVCHVLIKVNYAAAQNVVCVLWVGFLPGQDSVEAKPDLVQRRTAPVNSGTKWSVKVCGSKKFDQTMVE
jgi:hypothetical protein